MGSVPCPYLQGAQSQEGSSQDRKVLLLIRELDLPPVARDREEGAKLLALLVRALSEKGQAAERACFKFWEQNRSSCRICDVTMTNYGFADGVLCNYLRKKNLPQT